MYDQIKDYVKKALYVTLETIKELSTSLMCTISALFDN